MDCGRQSFQSDRIKRGAHIAHAIRVAQIVRAVLALDGVCKRSANWSSTFVYSISLI